MGIGKMDDLTYTPTKIVIGQPASAASVPTSVPGSDTVPAGNSTDAGATTSGSGSLRYIVMGASLLLGLIAIVGTLVWLSKR